MVHHYLFHYYWGFFDGGFSIYYKGYISVTNRWISSYWCTFYKCFLKHSFWRNRWFLACFNGSHDIMMLAHFGCIIFNSFIFRITCVDLCTFNSLAYCHLHYTLVRGHLYSLLETDMCVRYSRDTMPCLHDTFLVIKGDVYLCNAFSLRPPIQIKGWCWSPLNLLLWPWLSFYWVGCVEVWSASRVILLGRYLVGDQD